MSSGQQILTGRACERPCQTCLQRRSCRPWQRRKGCPSSSEQFPRPILQLINVHTRHTCCRMLLQSCCSQHYRYPRAVAAGCERLWKRLDLRQRSSCRNSWASHQARPNIQVPKLPLQQSSHCYRTVSILKWTSDDVSRVALLAKRASNAPCVI